jgi:aspartate-semialdehyde dehydrogenase
MSPEAFDTSDTERSASGKIPVGVLGATGSVGQRFVSLLAQHPWFEVALLTASERSAGKPYAEAANWVQETPIPAPVAGMVVRPTKGPLPCRLLFSALSSAAASAVEADLARAGHFVVSNAKSHRMDADVPLVIPEVNPEHLGLLAAQTYGPGALVTNPNCSTIGLVLALKPLADKFGLRRVHVVTLQALSGAGIPGVPSMAVIDNIVPYIGGEEEKLETEPQKILGQLRHAGSSSARIEHAEIQISAQCTRVAVSDGHSECISVQLARPAELAEVRQALAEFSGEPQRLGLPSAPARPVEVSEEEDRPQPRLDRGRGHGMATTVGRLRPCPLFDYKFVALSHNTLRGAAGGSILLAELALAKGAIPGLRPPTSSTSDSS